MWLHLDSFFCGGWQIDYKANVFTQYVLYKCPTLKDTNHFQRYSLWHTSLVGTTIIVSFQIISLSLTKSASCLEVAAWILAGQEVNRFIICNRKNLNLLWCPCVFVFAWIDLNSETTLYGNRQEKRVLTDPFESAHQFQETQHTNNPRLLGPVILWPEETCSINSSN